MVRLPNAISPIHQQLFRLLLGLLPRLFRKGEIIRYIRDLTTLNISACYRSIYGNQRGMVCEYKRCDGRLHDAREHYKEIAEAFLCRVYTWADRPETLKEELIDLLLDSEHNAVNRTKPRVGPPPAFVTDRVNVQEAERKARQMV